MSYRKFLEMRRKVLKNKKEEEAKFRLIHNLQKLAELRQGIKQAKEQKQIKKIEKQARQKQEQPLILIKPKQKTTRPLNSLKNKKQSRPLKTKAQQKQSPLKMQIKERQEKQPRKWAAAHTTPTIKRKTTQMPLIFKTKTEQPQRRAKERIAKTIKPTTKQHTSNLHTITPKTSVIKTKTHTLKPRKLGLFQRLFTHNPRQVILKKEKAIAGTKKETQATSTQTIKEKQPTLAPTLKKRIANNNTGAQPVFGSKLAQRITQRQKLSLEEKIKLYKNLGKLEGYEETINKVVDSLSEKEAIKIIVTLGKTKITLAEQGVKPKFLLKKAVPAVAEVLKGEQLARAIEQITKSAEQMREKGMSAAGFLGTTVPAVAETVKEKRLEEKQFTPTIQEITKITMELPEKGISATYFLFSSVPAVAKTVKGEQLVPTIREIAKTAEELKKQGISEDAFMGWAIPAAAEALKGEQLVPTIREIAKTAEELKKQGISKEPFMRYAIPAVAKTTRGEELNLAIERVKRRVKKILINKKVKAEEMSLIDFKLLSDKSITEQEYLEAKKELQKLKEQDRTIQQKLEKMDEAKLLLKTLKMFEEIKDPTQKLTAIDYLNELTTQEIKEINLEEPIYPQLQEKIKQKMSKIIGIPANEIKNFDAKILKGIEFIQENEEVQELLKKGFTGEYKQYYDSLEENKKTIREMQKIGINTREWEKTGEVKFIITSEGAREIQTNQKVLINTAKQVVIDSLKGNYVNPKLLFNKIRKEIGINPKNIETKEQAIKAMKVVTRELKGIKNNKEVENILFHANEVEIGFETEVTTQKGKKAPEAYILKFTDKNPATTLAIGNASGCCVAIDGINNWTLPLYLKDKATQLPEIWTVKKSGGRKRIGNAFLFAAKTKRGEPVLIIDTINVGGEYQGKEELMKKTIQEIRQYAEKAGFKKVLMGKSYNNAAAYAEGKYPYKTFYVEKIDYLEEEMYSDALPEGLEGKSAYYEVK